LPGYKRVGCCQLREALAMSAPVDVGQAAQGERNSNVGPLLRDLVAGRLHVAMRASVAGELASTFSTGLLIFIPLLGPHRQGYERRCGSKNNVSLVVNSARRTIVSFVPLAEQSRKCQLRILGIPGQRRRLWMPLSWNRLRKHENKGCLKHHDREDHAGLSFRMNCTENQPMYEGGLGGRSFFFRWF
jgi:hypothetical protein